MSCPSRKGVNCELWHCGGSPQAQAKTPSRMQRFELPPIPPEEMDPMCNTRQDYGWLKCSVPLLPAQPALFAGSLAAFALVLHAVNGNVLPAALALTRYQVHVLADGAAELAQVRTQVPDAYFVQGDRQVFILAGTFINRSHAQRRQADLERLGLSVRVVSRQETDPPLPPAFPAQAAPSRPAASSKASVPPTPTAPPLDPQRPFATHVPNPTGDPRLEERVRRFFPGATVVQYRGQVALQTGTFSRLSLAQDQARWLTAQGLPAVAVSLVGENAGRDPISNPAQGERYWVLVADPTGEKWPALKQLLEGSLPLIYDDLRVVRTGGFADPAAAAEQVRYLAGQGYEAGIFPADLRRSQPLLQADPVSSSPAQAVPPGEEGGSGFWVVVPAGEEALPKLQQFAPDAFLRGSVIQVGTYRQRANAEQARRSLAEAGFDARILPVE
ncbi:SPOR domain-containing protein [Thermostichus sp. MS-CIW-28]